MSNIIEDYFINPIIERSGYNIVNTLAYAIIAIIAAYLIYRIFKKYFTKELILYTIPFILLGSTVRVITDATDSGIDWGSHSLYWLFGPILKSGIYNYGFFTVTPGIYILIGSITLLSLYLSIKLKKPKIYPLIGLILWIPHFLIILAMLENLTYLVIISLLSIAIIFVSHLILKRYKINGVVPRFAVAAHALDGVSSFVAIEIFNRISSKCLEQGICYFGQHVVERFFSGIMIYGTILYLLVKVAFSIFACMIIEKESDNDNEKYFLYLLIVIFGLAPGIRNFLRIVLGV